MGIRHACKSLRIIFGQLSQGKIKGMKDQQFGIMRLGKFNSLYQRKFGCRPEF
jgi:hypothetical protein